MQDKKILEAQAEALEAFAVKLLSYGFVGHAKAVSIARRQVSELRAQAAAEQPTKSEAGQGERERFEAWLARLTESLHTVGVKHAAWLAWQARSRQPDQAAAQPEKEGELHPATQEAFERFTSALYEKLRAAEKKYGYSDGWLKADWEDECISHMHQHITKGDPLDVANYCMFLWIRGWATRPSQCETDNVGYAIHLREQRDGLIEQIRKLSAHHPDSGEWQWVPKEPTEEMLRAGMEESPICIKRMYERDGDPRFSGTAHGFDTVAVGEIFKAMLADAPKDQQP